MTKIMPDHSHLLARETVNLDNPHDVELWTNSLDIYTADLFMAVAAVGESSRSVFDYLHANGIPGRASGRRDPRRDAHGD